MFQSRRSGGWVGCEELECPLLPNPQVSHRSECGKYDLSIFSFTTLFNCMFKFPPNLPASFVKSLEFLMVFGLSMIPKLNSLRNLHKSCNDVVYAWVLITLYNIIWNQGDYVDIGTERFLTNKQNKNRPLAFVKVPIQAKNRFLCFKELKATLTFLFFIIWPILQGLGVAQAAVTERWLAVNTRISQEIMKKPCIRRTIS